MTSSELHAFMLSKGCACRGPNLDSQKAKLRHFCELYADNGVTGVKELTTLTGLRKDTCAKYQGIAQAFRDGRGSDVPDNPSVRDIKHMRAGEKSPTKSEYNNTLAMGGQAADDLRANLVTIFKDRLANPAELSVQDMTGIVTSLSKIVAGLEAPKQTVNYQVLVGPEGRDHALEKLSENLKWLADRNELPPDLESYFRLKYGHRGLDPRDEIEVSVPDSDSDRPLDDR